MRGSFAVSTPAALSDQATKQLPPGDVRVQSLVCYAFLTVSMFIHLLVF